MNLPRVAAEVTRRTLDHSSFRLLTSAATVQGFNARIGSGKSLPIGWGEDRVRGGEGLLATPREGTMPSCASLRPQGIFLIDAIRFISVSSSQCPRSVQ